MNAGSTPAGGTTIGPMTIRFPETFAPHFVTVHDEIGDHYCGIDLHKVTVTHPDDEGECPVAKEYFEQLMGSMPVEVCGHRYRVAREGESPAEILITPLEDMSDKLASQKQAVECSDQRH